MNGSKHTPGPWWVGKIFPDIIIEDNAGKEIRQYVPEDGQWEADAMLMAAAPDLVKACELLFDRIKDLNCEIDLESLEDAMNEVETAINKARGIK